MKEPKMPQQLKRNLEYFFRNKDVDAIVALNRAWNEHVEEVYKEQAKLEAEKGENANENL